MTLPSSRSAIRSSLPATGAVLSTGAVLAVGTMLVALLAGCGGSSSSGAGKGPAGNAPLSPAKAITLAAAQHINSLSADVTIQAPGLSNPLTETINERLRPTLLGDMTMKGLSVGGSAPLSLEAIMTGNAMYLKDSALSHLTSKPWLK